MVTKGLINALAAPTAILRLKGAEIQESGGFQATNLQIGATLHYLNEEITFVLCQLVMLRCLRQETVQGPSRELDTLQVLQDYHQYTKEWLNSQWSSSTSGIHYLIGSLNPDPFGADLPHYKQVN